MQVSKNFSAHFCILLPLENSFYYKTQQIYYDSKPDTLACTEKPPGLYHTIQLPGGFQKLTSFYFTVTRHFFISFPVFTVITAVPFPLAVTLPLELTTATFLFEVV